MTESPELQRLETERKSQLFLGSCQGIEFKVPLWESIVNSMFSLLW